MKAASQLPSGVLTVTSVMSGARMSPFASGGHAAEWLCAAMGQRWLRLFREACLSHGVDDRTGPVAHSAIYCTQSAHFWMVSLPPQAITGTEDVEFFGEPSMRRSE
jgi:hypothetical protein